MIYQELLKAVEGLPKGAVERTKKEITRKGYDTTGYQYQFLVNVMNDTLGIEGWYFDYDIIKELEGKYNNGKPWWDITVNITITIIGKERDSVTNRKCAGGHRSEMYADALKGAITNGFKKTVALFGVGKKAYEGTIDEDFRPLDSGSNTPKKVSFPQSDSKPPKDAEKGEKSTSSTPVLKLTGKPCTKDEYIDALIVQSDKHGIDISDIVAVTDVNKDFADMEVEELMKVGAGLAKAIKSLK